MHTNFQDLIPQRVLFSIKEIADLGIIKSDLCKKLILNRKIEVIKLGNKNFISRAELIRYLQVNTISTIEIENVLKSA